MCKVGLCILAHRFNGMVVLGVGQVCIDILLIEFGGELLEINGKRDAISLL
jgi:hypothetical protein